MTGGARVFVSYSRSDEEFARDLLISLESHGFETFFDKDDLMPGEPWAERLEAFIHKADTVAYLVSTHSMASEQCAKELDIALAQGKRVIPLVIDGVDYSQLPDTLRRLQFIFFHGPEHSYARGLAQLVTALKTDVDWVRAHTRLTDQAREWDSAGRNEGFLLRGAALQSATEWLSKPTPAQMSVLPLTAEYIEQAQQREKDDRLKRARAQLRGVLVASVAVLLALGLGLSFFYGQQLKTALDEAQRQRAAAEAARAIAEEESQAADARVDAAEQENDRLRSLLGLDGRDAINLGAAAQRARFGIEDMAPYLANLVTDNTALRRGARDDIAALLTRLNDGELNRAVIARARSDDDYRVRLGIAYAISRLPAGAPMADLEGAVADLQAMCTAEGALRSNLNAAINRLSPSAAGCPGRSPPPRSAP